MDRLSEIIANKRQRVESAKRLVSKDQLREKISEKRSNAGRFLMLRALEAEGTNIIAEFKRRSPSKGVIRVDADADVIARSYESGGAAAISVLTEQDYFDGSLKDLELVKATVKLPVLRKDFIFDEYQVYESAAAGADAILLIVAALESGMLQSLRQLAEDKFGMDALVEVHCAAEMDRAVEAGATLIGVNNRNLQTFEVSLETSERLSGLAPQNAVLISESGLSSAADLRRLKQVGYRGFLIGESLMRAERPDQALRELLA